jgi:hypothetical protein
MECGFNMRKYRVSYWRRSQRRGTGRSKPLDQNPMAYISLFITWTHRVLLAHGSSMYGPRSILIWYALILIQIILDGSNDTRVPPFSRHARRRCARHRDSWISGEGRQQAMVPCFPPHKVLRAEESMENRGGVYYPWGSGQIRPWCSGGDPRCRWEIPASHFALLLRDDHDHTWRVMTKSPDALQSLSNGVVPLWPCGYDGSPLPSQHSGELQMSRFDWDAEGSWGWPYILGWHKVLKNFHSWHIQLVRRISV